MSMSMEPGAASAPAGAMFSAQSTRQAGFWRSPAVKFFTTGGLSLLLMVPLLMVLALTSDRESRRDEVAQSVGREWGTAQTVFGPVLVIPYVANRSASGDRPAEPVLQHLAVLPETLQVKATANAEERSVSIYDVPVFSSAIAASGRFGPVASSAFGGDTATIFWDRAYISLAITDLTGVEDAALTIRGSEKLAFEPGVSADGSFVMTGGGVPPMPPGIHAVLGGSGPIAGFDYVLDLRLRGSDSLRVAPVGRHSEISIRSNWPHPNFTVGMLPSERKVADTGFDATWRVPYLARTTPQTWVIERDGFARLGGDLLGVGFVSPVDLYALVERALKYGVMFIGLTFLTVFMLEVFSSARIHVVQYSLVGLVLVMFFVLLLALAERIGFGPAYLIASVATGGVVSAFVGTALASPTRGLVSAASFALTFGLLYAILRLEDLALLAGAVVGFVVLSLVLFATRRVDWSGLGSRVSALPQVQTSAS